MPIKAQTLLLNLIYENIINYIFITFVNELCGWNMAKMKIGKRCTVSDTNQLQESSYVGL